MEDKTFRNEYSTYMKDFCDNLEMKNLNVQDGIHKKYSREINKVAEILLEQNAKDKKYKLPFDTDTLEKCMAKMHKYSSDINKGAIQSIKMESKKAYHINRLYQKFSDDSFDDKLDSDPDLLGFENGLLDLRNMEFRRAKKGEYVCMSVGYNFPTKTIDPNGNVIDLENNDLNDKVEYLEKLLKEMFLNEEDYVHIMKALSRSLRGESNKEECCYFLKGVGANGKSLILALMRLCMGEYAYNLSYKLFVHESKNNHDVELNGANKMRFVEISEPNEKFVWNSDFFKRTTGQDPIASRTHHQKKMSYFKMGNLWCASNYFIKFSSDTGGNSMKRRVRGCEFPFSFYIGDRMAEYDSKNPLHKIGDEEIKVRIEKGEFNEAMMVLLMKYYTLYKEEGLELTETFKSDTAKYFDNISEDRKWFNDNLIKDDKFNITTSSLLKKYNEEMNCNWGTKYFCKKLREYFGDCVSKTSGYNVWDFTVDGIKNAYGTNEKVDKCRGNMLKGFRFKVDPEDPEEPEENDELDQNNPLDVGIQNTLVVQDKIVKKKKKKIKKKIKLTKKLCKSGCGKESKYTDSCASCMTKQNEEKKKSIVAFD